MRKYAILKESINEIKKVMLYESHDGVYIFLYDVIDDYPAFADNYFSALEDAEEVCSEEYSIKDSDWIIVDEPPKNCQHDIISPVRIKGRDLGKPQWGEYEKFVNGKWIDYKFHK